MDKPENFAYLDEAMTETTAHNDAHKDAHDYAYDMVFIAGPTASGKSALAITLAEMTTGSVINTDSMQVYGGMPILTAAPDTKDYQTVPHYLFEYVDAAERYSQARWLADATKVVGKLKARGELPIFVGGSGLYFKAAEQGITPMPEITSHVQKEAETMLATMGTAGLHDYLAQVDPELAARLEQGDSQRIMRGVEVWLASKKPMSAWQKEPRQGGFHGHILKIYLRPPRDHLYARINERFAAMMDHGAEEEVRAMVETRHLDASLPAMKALGVEALSDAITGKIPWDEAIRLSQRDSRRYAKRQFTWFDHQYDADMVVTDMLDERLISDTLSAIMDRLKAKS